MKIGEKIRYDERLKITRVFENIWLLDDADNGSGYVVTGNDKALVVDTCNGMQDYLAAVRSLTDLPVVLVNTHAHGDHVGGNRYFEKALIGEAELPEYEEYVQESGCCRAEVIREGDIIDLGGKTVEAVSFPGHTPGGICLLDREDRVLFTGDSVLGRTVWLFMDNSVPVSEMKKSLIHLNTRRGEFDWLLTGHSRKIDDPGYIDELIDACDVILAGGPAERLGQVEIWEQTWECCYYTGEDGMKSTLVYRKDLAR